MLQKITERGGNLAASDGPLPSFVIQDPGMRRFAVVITAKRAKAFGGRRKMLQHLSLRDIRAQHLLAFFNFLRGWLQDDLIAFAQEFLEHANAIGGTVIQGHLPYG